MVKNVGGGNRHKSFARKNAKPFGHEQLRVAQSELEVYAVVTKMLGNCMFHARTLSGQQMMGHIRGKFTGRRKRSAFVAVGTWVLLGRREWSLRDDDDPSEKREQCDLLEVYSSTDQETLRTTVHVDWSLFAVSETVVHDDTVVFTTVQEDERDQMCAAAGDATLADVGLDEQIDIDDI